MAYGPEITVGGKYGTSIIFRGNTRDLPRPAQNIIRRYFNKYRAMSDPAQFPFLLSELRSIIPPIPVTELAVDRYNKYLEIHTVVLSGEPQPAQKSIIPPGAAKAKMSDIRHGAVKIFAGKKSDRTTPRIGAILRSFCGDDGALAEPERLWEFGERIRDASGLVVHEKSFSKPFEKLARTTAAFHPSAYFKYQIEAYFHPKFLLGEYREIVEPELEVWEFTERSGKPGARRILKEAASLFGIVNKLAAAGCKTFVLDGALHNARRSCLISGVEPPRHEFLVSKPVQVKDNGDKAVRSISVPEFAVKEKDLADCTSAELYSYQKAGVRHLAHTGRAMLADDMGLGKSVQAIAALRILAARGGLKRAIIICPASLKYQWKNEIERFTELSPVVVEGDQTARVAIYRGAAQSRYTLDKFPAEKLPQIFILNYELSFRDEKYIAEMKPDAIILDEAQRIKNWQSKTHQAIVEMPARYRFVLTGTPLENELMELYSVLQFVDKSVLGENPLDVRRRYTVYDKFGGIAGYQHLREASRRISGVSLRRTREETLTELPELIESYWWLELETEQWKIYRDLEARIAEFLSSEEWDKVKRDSAMTTVQRLREVCDTPEMLFPEQKQSAKLRELKVLLSEQAGEMKRQAIIFTQWTRMAEILKRELASWGFEYRYMHGAMNARERAKIIDEFNGGDAQIFLSTDAGSAGINLQAASIVVNFDLPFNPAIVAQRIARAHRHGQKSCVNAWHLVCRGTIEENLVKILRRRKALFTELMSEVGDGSALREPPEGSRSFLIELLGKMVPPLGAENPD